MLKYVIWTVQMPFLSLFILLSGSNQALLPRICIIFQSMQNPLERKKDYQRFEHRTKRANRTVVIKSCFTF